jgi:glycosyltransferase involved in cell wall biosynthesis
MSIRHESKLRVLMVTARYFPYLGGVENHVYQVARRLAQQGVDITVLSTDPGGQLPPTEELEGVKVRRVSVVPGTGDSYLAPDIYRVISAGQWDVIHCQCYHTFVPPLAMLAALRTKTRYVLTFHGGGHSSRLRNSIRPIQIRMLRPLLARASRLIATARFETDFFGRQLGLPAEQFVFIPNGGDIAQTPIPAHETTAGPLIASVGRLEQYKGHHRVIQALPKIVEVYPDARLWIAGDGPYEPTLRRMAQQLGVADRVDIRSIPAAERQQMAVELSKAALVTLLSEYETHPMAAMEAIALGRSLLVADTSGLSELAKKGLARAIPLNSSTEQVAAAMLDQLRNPLIPPQDIDLLSWDECATALLDLYKQVAPRAAYAV